MKNESTKLKIPNHWTGKQATLIVEFLNLLDTAIWNKHETKILNHMCKRQSKTNNKNDETFTNDDSPF